ncbi:hypothetical protein TRVL_03008 [Trypanosoma vivax]|nr:hypothetical protein TRVL_03008 [Trypanosoma vivax]
MSLTSTLIFVVGGALREASGLAMWLSGELKHTAQQARRNAANMQTAAGGAKNAVKRAEFVCPEEVTQPERDAHGAEVAAQTLHTKAPQLAAISLAEESDAATIEQGCVFPAYTVSGGERNVCKDSSTISGIVQTPKSSKKLKTKCEVLYGNNAKKGFPPTLPPDTHEITSIVNAIKPDAMEKTLCSALSTDSNAHIGAKPE